jgi:hypothetical protein
MNADAKGQHAQRMTTREDVSRRSQAKAEPFQAAIQSAPAAGCSDWLAADEAAPDYIATRIAPKFGVSVEVVAKRLRVEKLWPPP